MELKTRCPRCGTSFAASVELLQRRRGYIRCIQCAHIFDGFEAVIDDDAAEPTYDVAVDRPAAPAPKTEPVFIESREPLAVEHVDLQAKPQGPRFVQHSRHAPPRDEGSAHDSLQVRKFPDSVMANAPVVPAQPSVLRSRSPDPRDEDASFFVSGADVPAESDDHHIGQSSWRGGEPDFSVGDRVNTLRAAYPSRQADGTESAAEPPQDWTIPSNPALQRETRYAGEAGVGQRAWSLLWKLLCVLGLLVLLAQLVYVYRVQIASHVPVLRPVLEQACAGLGCQVPYERRQDDIRVVSSALHKEPGEGSRSVLRFTLRNEFERPQEWPTLVLDLKDFSGALIARRNISPTQYLAPERQGEPFAARTELMVQLPLDTGGLQVNGYQISPFFP